MSNSRKQKERAAASKSSSGGKPEKASVPESGEGWRWPLADRPLSMEEFAKLTADKSILPAAIKVLASE
ncbi:MAG: hypothetical protein OXI17_03745 [Gammaproteobacteria bacterium]|nr:hypothetical protein [Gammaproteobacteria bacterium]